VIGINSAELLGQGVSGLGFALPINLALAMAGQVLATGRYVRPFLGIAFRDVDADLASQFRLPVRQGVLITDVQRGSPAATGGLREQDIITRVNDTPVAMGGDLRRVLRNMKPGDTARLTVVRPPNGSREHGSPLTPPTRQAPFGLRRSCCARPESTLTPAMRSRPSTC
jgi:serine protease Do